MRNEIDFNRAAMLLHIVGECSPNSYPWLKFLHDAAMEELKAMAPKPEERSKVVTPADGPANSAVETKHGIERLPNQQRPQITHDGVNLPLKADAEVERKI